MPSAAAMVIEGHKAEVNSVAFNFHDVNILASGSSDKTAGLWDVRAMNKKLHSFEFHQDQVFNVGWAPHTSNILATSRYVSVSTCRHVFALKKKEVHIASFDHFTQFSFHCLVLFFAPRSADRRLCLWNLNAIGQEQDAEDAEDGPPELLFLHAGHTDKIVDFSWNGNDEWVIASVADDNVLQVWQPAAAVCEDDDDEEEEDGEGDAEDADLE
jgi:WD40 repeat protein